MRRAALLGALLIVPSIARANPELVATGADAITSPGKAVTVRAKFAQSGFRHEPAAGEPVTMSVLGETRWVRTDANGVAATSVTPQAPGVSYIETRSARDESLVVRSRLFVLDGKRPVAAVELDGALTDIARFRVSIFGEKADTFPGAADLLADLAKTHQIIYLTGRSSNLDQKTRYFLGKQGFPDGPIVYRDTGLGVAGEGGDLSSKDAALFKLAQIDALEQRGVPVSLGLGASVDDAWAFEKAGVKGYLKGTDGNGFHFDDYATLRKRLEAEGTLPVLQHKGSLAGTWKFSYRQEGVEHDGILETHKDPAGGVGVTVNEEGAPSWTAHANVRGKVFTLERTLTPGVIGVLSATTTDDALEYVVTYHENDEANVEVFRVRGAARTRVGGGTLTRPPYFSGLREQVDSAIAHGDDAIEKLGAEALAVATPDEKVAMINVLMSSKDAQTLGVRNLNPIPVKKAKQEAILRILRSAADPAAFDRVFFRLNEGRLLSALTGKRDDEARALIEKAEKSAKPGDWDGYLEYLDTVTEAVSSGRNQADFLVDGENVIPVGLAAVRAAKESIHLSVFQWEADETGYAFAKELIAKAKTGVKVRVLVDEQGTGKDEKAKALEAFMRANGIDLVVNKAPLLKGHLDHRKVLVIDGKVGFAGGMNLGDDYQKIWHDQQTRLEGPMVAKLQDAFLSRWTEEGGAPPLPNENLYPALAEVPGGTEMRVIPHAGAGADRNIKAAYLRAFATAQTRIRIATPYFADQDVVDALCAAARRGVQVQVVLPKDNDQAIMKRAAKAFYPQLVAAGVEVYEYQDRMAHEKVATIDGKWATAGSSNLDDRSLEFNDELNYVTIDPKFAKTVDSSLFDKDLHHSVRITGAKSGVTDWLMRKVAGWL